MGQTQFRSDDTVRWWLGFGNGSDGDYSSVGNATDAPVDSSCSGTAGSTSLSATNASFASGKPVLIHQTRGTGAGTWELNQIDSYVAGTITLKKVLQNTYTDSGASQAQVIQLKQYNNFTQNSGHTLTAKAWNGTVGGFIVFLCKGTVTIAGTITAAACGFRGNVNYSGVGDRTGYQGEGNIDGGGTLNGNANGNAGGAGTTNSGSPNRGGGAGGGHATAGVNGAAGASVSIGGLAVGNTNVTTIFFGGSGGAGGFHSVNNSPGSGGGGGNGGGAILIFSKALVVNNTAVVSVGGGNGGNGGAHYAGGGGGAGGSILLKTQTATLNTNKIVATAGSGGINGSPNNGSAGSVGRIHLDYSVSYSGSTNPTLDVRQDLTIQPAATGGSFLFHFV